MDHKIKPKTLDSGVVTVRACLIIEVRDNKKWVKMKEGKWMKESDNKFKQ